MGFVRMSKREPGKLFPPLSMARRVRLKNDQDRRLGERVAKGLDARFPTGTDGFDRQTPSEIDPLGPKRCPW